MQLAVIQTHPIQYLAPLYREIEKQGIPVTAIYGSDFSVAGYEDEEFGVSFSWDTDLLSGYTTRFLSRVEEGGAERFESVTTDGLSQTLRAVDPDAVLLSGYSPRFHRRAALKALWSPYPVLFRAETTDHAVERGPLKRTIRDGLLTALYRQCRRLLYVGERSYDHYRRLGCPDEKLVFSPYCVDTSPFRLDEAARSALRPEARRELSLDPDRFVLLFSGKISARKGPDLLVDAVRGLPAATRKRLAIVFLGDGDMRADLEAEGGDLRLRFPGFQNQHQLSRYYHAADALVLPSRGAETWGLVVNEALHHGLPCIVSDAVGSAPDLVEPGRTGEVFPSGSSDALSEAIERLLDWYDRTAQDRQRCREQVADYTVERAAEGVVEAVSDVVQSGA